MCKGYWCCYFSFLEDVAELADDEVGRLVKALTEYAISGVAPTLTGNERFLFPTLKARIDRDFARYEARCEANRKAIMTRWHSDESDGIQSNTNEYECIRTDTKDTKNKKKNKNKKNDIYTPHGAYGWVKLTDDQFQKLVADLGAEEVERCIQYIDESAQSSNNKNKWKDWNLVVRRCSREGWGRPRQTKQSGWGKTNKDSIDYDSFLKEYSVL